MFLKIFVASAAAILSGGTSIYAYDHESMFKWRDNWMNAAELQPPPLKTQAVVPAELGFHAAVEAAPAEAALLPCAYPKSYGVIAYFDAKLTFTDVMAPLQSGYAFISREKGVVKVMGRNSRKLLSAVYPLAAHESDYVYLYFRAEDVALQRRTGPWSRGRAKPIVALSHTCDGV